MRGKCVIQLYIGGMRIIQYVRLQILSMLQVLQHKKLINFCKSKQKGLY